MFPLEMGPSKLRRHKHRKLASRPKTFTMLGRSDSPLNQMARGHRCSHSPERCRKTRSFSWLPQLTANAHLMLKVARKVPAKQERKAELSHQVRLCSSTPTTTSPSQLLVSVHLDISKLVSGTYKKQRKFTQQGIVCSRCLAAPRPGCCHSCLLLLLVCLPASLCNFHGVTVRLSFHLWKYKSQQMLVTSPTIQSLKNI